MRRKFYDISESFDFDNQETYLEDIIENYNLEKLFKKFSKFMSEYAMPYVFKNELDMIVIGDWTIALPIPIEYKDQLWCFDKNENLSFYLNSQGICLDFYVSEYDVIDTYDELESDKKKREFKKFLIDVLSYDGDIMKRIGYHDNKIHESFDFDSVQEQDFIEPQVELYNVVRFKNSVVELANLIKEFFKVAQYRRSWLWNKDDMLFQVLGSHQNFIEEPYNTFKIAGKDNNSRIFFKTEPDDVVMIELNRRWPITVEISKQWTPRLKEIKSLVEFGIERAKKGGFQEAIDEIVNTVYNLFKKNPRRLGKYGSVNSDVYDEREFQKIWKPYDDVLMGIEELWMIDPKKYEIRGKIGRLDSDYLWGSSCYFVNPIDFDYFYNNIMTALK